jgi:DNA-binding GntR family transcriptional regulator
MPTAIQAPTLAQYAYKTLRSLILSSELEPGSRLVVRVLSERYGLSPTPFKEALVALEREGLVSSRPRRGYSVATIDVASVRQRYQIREVLEALAARLAAERMSPPLLRQLEELHAVQATKFAEADLAGSGDADLDFHRALWYGSGNPALAQMLETFTGQVTLMMSSTRAKVPSRHAQALQEHEVLIDRLRAADADGAEAAMRRHIRASGTALYDRLNEAGSGARQAPAHLHVDSPAD